MIGLLIDLIVSILIFFMLMFAYSYLTTTMALAGMPVTVQATIIGLSRLQQINQTYGDDPSMQIAILQAQNNLLEIANSQILATTQTVNKLLYIYDLFNNLSSIEDFLKIFAILLILIIISLYIYKRHKNNYFIKI